MKSPTATVEEVLARHSGHPVDSISPSDRLQSDLRLHPLEVALVIVELEEIAGVRIPFSEIGSIRTVDDLLSCVSRQVARIRSASHTKLATQYLVQRREASPGAGPAAHRK